MIPPCSRVVALCGLVLLTQAWTASAQIYTWRDANGHLVLSNKRPADGQPMPASAVTEAIDSRPVPSGPADRSQKYEELIAENARLNGIRPSLVRAVIQVESGFNPIATSDKGAMGLMQLMPATARQLGVRNPYNPTENVRGGVAYLRQLLDRYGDDEELALAAYNAGPGAVDRYGQQVPPYRETKGYVTKVNEIAGDHADDESVVRLGTTRVYKVIDIIDGRPVVRYTDRKPDSGK